MTTDEASLILVQQKMIKCSLEAALTLSFELISFILGSFHQLRLHLGVGRWLEIATFYHSKRAN